jgi:hypothetical protein
MKIDYQLKGKSVDPESIADETKKKAIRVATNFVIERVQDIKDTKTGLTPEITIIDEPEEGLSFQVSGPEALRSRVEKALFDG